MGNKISKRDLAPYIDNIIDEMKDCEDKNEYEFEDKDEDEDEDEDDNEYEIKKRESQ